MATATTRTTTMKTTKKKTKTKKTQATRQPAAAPKKTTTTTTTTTKTKTKKKPTTKAKTASLVEFCAVLGESVDDGDVSAFFVAQRLKPEKTDKIKGEPHAVFWRNDGAGVCVTAEDAVCVAVDVDDTYEGGLINGLGWGASRNDVAATFGAPVVAERFYDTFHVDELRVVGNFVKDALVGLRVEPWQHQVARDDKERRENASAAPVVVEARPPLPEPWTTTLPTVTALRALLGQPSSSTVLALLEATGHLRRDSFSEGALLRGDAVGLTVAIDKDGIVDDVNVGIDWNGGYEDGFVAGAVGRKEARDRYGPPTHEAPGFDIWDHDGVRRWITYLDTRVMAWQVQLLAGKE